MIFPIGDTNVKGGAKPLVSYTILVCCILVFFGQLNSPGNLVCSFGTIPNNVVQGTDVHTLITSMFLHGGWMHLIGNMLFLWVFADNIEAIVGNWQFLLFYFFGGLAATATHIFFDLYTANAVVNCCAPCLSNISCSGAANICSGSIPSIGASGAISAVMGAYIVMFPGSRIRTLFFITILQIPAIIFLGLWFAQQLVAGIGSLGPMDAQTSGVAWWAHIGGFVVGLIYGFANRHKMRYVSRKTTEY